MKLTILIFTLVGLCFGGMKTDTLTVSKGIRASSLRLPTGSLYRIIDTAFICTLHAASNITGDSVGYIRYSRINANITVYVGGFSAGFTSTGIILVKSAPFDAYWASMDRSSLAYTASAAGGSYPNNIISVAIQGSCCAYPSITFYSSTAFTTVGEDTYAINICLKPF